VKMDTPRAARPSVGIPVSDLPATAIRALFDDEGIGPRLEDSILMSGNTVPFEESTQALEDAAVQLRNRRLLW
jgi:hypothetical protein